MVNPLKVLHYHQPILRKFSASKHLRAISIAKLHSRYQRRHVVLHSHLLALLVLLLSLSSRFSEAIPNTIKVRNGYAEPSRNEFLLNLAFVNSLSILGWLERKQKLSTRVVVLFLLDYSSHSNDQRR